MRRLSVCLAVAILMVGVAGMLPSAVLAAASDVPGTPLQLGQSASGNLDSTTKPNDVYSIKLTYGEQIKLTLSNAANKTGNAMWLLQPGLKSIDEGGSADVASTDTYNENNSGQIIYTPAVSGVYYVQVQAGGHSDVYQLSAAVTGVHSGGPQLPDVFGVAVGPGTYSGVLDSRTYPNSVYAVHLFRGEQVQLTVSNAADQTGNAMWLLQPGLKSIDEGGSADVASTDTYNENNSGQIIYTPAVSGVYYVQVQAGGHNDVYQLTVGGAAEQPPYPTHLWLRSSAARVRKGGYVKLSGSLNAALLNQGSPSIEHVAIVVLRSYDGARWSTISKISLPSGSYSLRERITRKTWFRTWFAGADGYRSCASEKVVVRTK